MAPRLFGTQTRDLDPARKPDSIQFDFIDFIDLFDSVLFLLFSGPPQNG
jgi:hypothetical protein